MLLNNVEAKKFKRVKIYIFFFSNKNMKNIRCEPFRSSLKMTNHMHDVICSAKKMDFLIERAYNEKNSRTRVR